MKVYLAGPMSHIKSFNIPAFDEAAAALRARGHDVVSPAEVDGETTRAVLLLSESGDHADLPPADGGWSAYLERDREILRAGGFDAIITLPGWERSPGANREVGICEGLGIPRLDYAPGAELGFATSATLHGDSLYDADGKFILFSDHPLRQRTASGGVKDNRGKPRLELIPFEPMMAVGRVLAFGAVKYKPNNWRLGLSWLETTGSALRHIGKFLMGQDVDEESGELHVDCAITQLMFLSTYMHTKTGQDDRWSSLLEADREEAKA